MTAVAAIHVARKQLDLTEAEARELYAAVTGKSSLRDMTPSEHGRVIDALRERGFDPARTGARRQLQGPFAKKLQALWIAAWNLGIVNNRDDRALIAFVQRQAGVSDTRFLHHKDDADKVIEAVKSWMAREARVVWRKSEIGEAGWRWLYRDGAKIAVAQWRLLAELGACPGHEGLAGFVRATIEREFNGFAEVDDRDWIAVMNALGELVRMHKARVAP